MAVEGNDKNGADEQAERELDAAELAERKERRQRREEAEREAEQPDAALTHSEREQAIAHRSLSAVAIYSVIRHEGEEELSRPATSLWWSGVAAGLGISTSVLAEAMLHDQLRGSPYQHLIENFGYTVGFCLVILSRLQLFTENTITVVLPILARPRRRKFLQAAKLWGIVFTANMAGTFLAAVLAIFARTTTPALTESMLEVSRHFAESSGVTALLLGIPAGFIIAALVWMLPSAKGTELFVIILFTYLIAACDFTHVIAGSNEVFLLVLNGEMNLGTAITSLIAPTLIGNIIGGTGLFAMLAYGQVHEEM
jgi:formate/nitrite transporter FocA (FNT family)